MPVQRDGELYPAAADIKSAAGWYRMTKNSVLGSVRHKDTCGVLKMWCGVAKGSVTSVTAEE